MKPRKIVVTEKVRRVRPPVSQNAGSRRMPVALYPRNIPKQLSKQEIQTISQDLKKGIPFVKSWAKGKLYVAGFKSKIREPGPELAKLCGRQVISITYSIGPYFTSAFYSLKGNLLAVQGANRKWLLAK
jgi:hypothetical protein